jgi:metal-sulfur cluster biosynthetic enzyme
VNDPQPEAPSAPVSETPAAAAAPDAPTGTPGVATIEEMKDAMKDVYDPEIPINIVDLGLIYDVKETASVVDITMSLTSPHCPVADQLKARVNEVVGKCKGVTAVNVNLTFEPMWTKEKMTFEGKLQASMLGIM